MKHAAFVLAIVVAAFVLGCQDSPLTDTIVTGANSSANMFSKAKPEPQRIPLSGILVEPGGFNTYAGIEGFIDVTANLANDGVVREFKVETSAFAELYPFDVNGNAKCGWVISGNATDVVAVKTSSQLEKVYTVEGREDGLLLHIRLHLGRDGKAQLDEMRLTKGKIAKEVDHT